MGDSQRNFIKLSGRVWKPETDWLAGFIDRISPLETLPINSY